MSREEVHIPGMNRAKKKVLSHVRVYIRVMGEQEKEKLHETGPGEDEPLGQGSWPDAGGWEEVVPILN